MNHLGDSLQNLACRGTVRILVATSKTTVRRVSRCNVKYQIFTAQKSRDKNAFPRLEKCVILVLQTARTSHWVKIHEGNIDARI